MGSVTMSFSSSGRATSTYNVQWYNDNIVTSFPLGTKVTTVDLIINYGLCNDSSSSGDHDISVQLEGKDLGSEVFISDVMLRGENGKFLDDLSVSDVENWINKKVTPIENTGAAFAQALIGIKEN